MVKGETKMAKTNAIIILDGLGLSDRVEGNAFKLANTPVLDELMKKYPTTSISASGLAVGLPEGQMGNSEVGHINIGAGRIVYQDSTAISKSIETGEFFSNSAIVGAMENCKRNNSALHILGLVSDGGVHSKMEHLFAVLKTAKLQGVDNVFIHCAMDGRDVHPTSGLGFIKELEAKMSELGVGKIATIIGRFYMMDRDNRWDRIEKAYNNIVNAVGARYDNAIDAMNDTYSKNITDEFIEPAVIGDYSGLNAGDSVIFFNYRTDRAREITRSLIYSDFDNFKRVGGYKPVHYVCMAQYDASFENCTIAFPPTIPQNTLGQIISEKGLTQARIAETEKYAHVTFFFNGGIEKPFAGEKRVLVPSPKVATYDLKPEMSALEVTDKVIETLDEGIDVLILNFANCDMVGHTGKLDAAIKAVETVDTCLGRVLDTIEGLGGNAIVTADHGNAECMIDENGEVCTSHTTNLVPLVVFGKKFKKATLRKGGRLCDIAPTLLQIMDIEKPKEMTGESLICE